MAGGPQHVRAGRISSPHGLDGSVKIADAVPGLIVLGAEVQVNGEDRRVVRFSGTEKRPIVRFSGSSTRNDAEALRDAVITVPRDEVPELGPDEWWTADLIGCAVVDGDHAVGVVVGVLPLPSCEALQVERADAALLLVPMIGDALRSVDLESRSVDVNLKFLGEETE
ncbi:MAG: ribosome maturation factor RimM [Actinomycetes bacterium]